MKFILRVDDVGRKPGDKPEYGTDNDLDYFFRWREAAGLYGLPVFYGVVPAWLSRRGLCRLKSWLEGNERTAVHGWNHTKNTLVTLQQMVDARNLLQTSGALAYIPPFNRYDDRTLNYWREAGGQMFFGGLVASKLPPRLEKDLIYLPAFGPFYGHIEEVLENLSLPQDQTEFPLVVTLHVPWDEESKWPLVNKLIRCLQNHLIDYSVLSEIMNGG